jgi:hypothetical protein
MRYELESQEEEKVVRFGLRFNGDVSLVMKDPGGLEWVIATIDRNSQSMTIHSGIPEDRGIKVDDDGAILHEVD